MRRIKPDALPNERTEASDLRDDSDLSERFPALERLKSTPGKRRIPFVQQLTSTDCGPACLTMVLRYHGKAVRVEDVRTALGTGRDGSNALNLFRAARGYGLRGRGVSLELDSLHYLDPGSILYWQFNHFVVLERIGRDWVEIVDPASGRRRVSMEEFSRSFTGVAMTFEPGDDFQASEGTSNRVWPYVRQMLVHSGILSRVLVTSALIQVFGLALPILTGLIVDRVLPQNDRGLLEVVGLGFLAVATFHFLSSFIRAHLILELRTRLDARMTLGFLEHLMNLPYAFFQRRSSGDLMLRMNSNAVVREMLTSGAVSGALDGFLVITYLAVILALSPAMGAIVLALGLFRVAIFMTSRKRIRDLMSESLRTQAESQSYQVQMLAGIETLKAAGAEPRAVERWSNLFVDVLNVNLARGRLNAFVMSVLGGLAFVSPLIVLFAGSLFVLDGAMSLGTMLALAALAAGFLGPLATLIATAMQLQELGSYIERLDDVLETAPEQGSRRLTAASGLRGGITLERVSFRYGPTAPLAISDVSLEIRPGDMVAIVGPSAAGKSTLAHLIVGLYVPNPGRILFDGTDLADLEIRSVRGQIGIVTQQAHLFGATIRENIALLDPEVSLESVVEAARLAHIHDEILAMPMGYDTILTNGGQSLSGGQKQRLVLARALLGHPAILLLDEATSALDAATEARIQASLASLRCTRIVIAHRLSTIAGADKIVVLENGRVVEHGLHEELLAEKGVYRTLLAAQIRVNVED